MVWMTAIREGSEMTREEIEKVAQHALGAAQRLGMQIAEKLACSPN
jgi:hypothetical protein